MKLAIKYVLPFVKPFLKARVSVGDLLSKVTPKADDTTNLADTTNITADTF